MTRTWPVEAPLGLVAIVLAICVTIIAASSHTVPGALLDALIATGAGTAGVAGTRLGSPARVLDPGGVSMPVVGIEATAGTGMPPPLR